MTTIHREADTEARRFDVGNLKDFARSMLSAVDVEEDLAAAMVDRMVDGDLLGHRTHGFWFLSTYLERIAGQHIRGQGDIDVVVDTPQGFTWNANRLPGAWVLQRATAELIERVQTAPVATAAINDCSHIGCLQSYLLPFTELGLVPMLAVSNPGVLSVAPFGGADPVVTTNPIAMGIPTRGEPILIDQCTSVASNALFQDPSVAGGTMPGRWLVDGQGVPTDDPAVLESDPPGTIMPLGGEDFGYKGFALAMMVETLSLALTGCGRRHKPDRNGQGVFLQVFNPAYFAGSSAFLDETDNLVSSIRASRVRPGGRPIRLPGERALADRREQLENGVLVAEQVWDRIRPWSDKFGLSLPSEIG